MKKINLSKILKGEEGINLINFITEKLYTSFSHGKVTNEIKINLIKIGEKEFKKLFSEILSSDTEDNVKKILTKYSVNNIITEDFLASLYGQYLGKKGEIRSSFINLLKSNGINICVYCNHSPINDVQLNYDHIYDKDTHKYFSFSLCNLLPTCTICNQIKSTNFYYNFYIDNITNDFDFKFKYKTLDNYMSDNCEEIYLERNNSDVTLKSYIEKFITPLYARKDGGEWGKCINNLKKIRKKKFYNDLNDLDLYEDGDYGEINKLDLEKIHKVPFSKFKLSAINKNNYDINLPK